MTPSISRRPKFWVGKWSVSITVTSPCPKTEPDATQDSRGESSALRRSVTAKTSTSRTLYIGAIAYYQATSVLVSHLQCRSFEDVLSSM